MVFNSCAHGMLVPPMPSEPSEKEEGNHMLVAKYRLNKHMVIQFLMPKSGEDALEMAIFAGTDDGSDEAGQHLLLGAMAFVVTLTQGYGPEQREEILEHLGIAPAVLMDGMPRVRETGGFILQSQYTKESGLIVMAFPATALP